MKVRKIISSICVILILNLSTINLTAVYAQEIINEDTTTEIKKIGGRFTHLLKDVKAPYEGYLLNPEATAKILTESKFDLKKAQLVWKYEKLKLEAEYKTQIEMLREIVKIREDSYENRIVAKDRDIEKYQDMIGKSSDKQMWFIVGGILGGIAVSVLIFFAAAEIAKR